MSSSKSNTKSGPETASNAAKSIADELSEEQLDDVSGGMTINAGVAKQNALTVPTGMTAGSIAEGDTIGGDGMPDAKTG